jgi:hypothetical protein
MALLKASRASDIACGALGAVTAAAAALLTGAVLGVATLPATLWRLLTSVMVGPRLDLPVYPFVASSTQSLCALSYSPPDVQRFGACRFL